jgi:His-Xaa-Ser system protein HxsD
MMEQTPSEGVTVAFARTAAFDVEAIKRAAYRFSDRVSVEIAETEAEQVCTLRKLTPDAKLDVQALVGEFRNEVLDQDLRMKIAAETADYRNLVLSLAFSKTPLGGQ